jgi:hypothetical protein
VASLFAPTLHFDLLAGFSKNHKEGAVVRAADDKKEKGLAVGRLRGLVSCGGQRQNLTADTRIFRNRSWCFCGVTVDRAY